MKNKQCVRQAQYQKGFIEGPVLTAIILGTIVLGSGAYFLTTQSTSQNANLDLIKDWKTYTDSQSKFELKYPSDWHQSSDATSKYFYKKFNENSSFVCSFGVVTINNPDYLKEVYPNNKKVDVNIGGIAAQKIEVLLDGINYGNYFIQNDKQNNSLEISETIEKIITNKNGQKVYSGTVNDQKCIDTFDQILATLKFTK